MNSWDAFDDAFQILIQRFVSEARKTRTTAVLMPRWESTGPGQLRYTTSHVYWTDQSLGAKLRSWNEFADMEQSALASPLRTHLGQIIGGSGLRFLFDLTSFTLATVGRSLKTTSTTVSIDEDIVRRRLDRLREMVESPEVETEILILLEGIELQRDLELADDLSLRRLDSGTIIKFIEAGALQPTLDSDNTPIVLLPESRRIALRKAYVEPKVIGLTGSIARGATSEIAEAAFETCADTLAIVTGRRPRVVAWLERLSNDALQSGWSTGKASVAARDTVVLDEQQRSRISSVWQSVDEATRLPKLEAVSLAVRRIGFAASRDRWQDRVLDVMIALEALLLRGPSKDRNELSFRASLRAAQLWPSGALGYSPVEVYAIVRKAYDLRSTIAHGGTVGEQQTFKVGRRTLHRTDFIEAVQAVGRVVTETALTYVGRTKAFTVDWDGKLATYLEGLEHSSEIENS